MRPTFPTPHATAPPASKVVAFVRMLGTREQIRRAKDAGAPWPWSGDAVLNHGKFTNVKREHDRATRLATRAAFDTRSVTSGEETIEAGRKATIETGRRFRRELNRSSFSPKAESVVVFAERSAARSSFRRALGRAVVASAESSRRWLRMRWTRPRADAGAAAVLFNCGVFRVFGARLRRNLHLGRDNARFG